MKTRILELKYSKTSVFIPQYKFIFWWCNHYAGDIYRTKNQFSNKENAVNYLKDKYPTEFLHYPIDLNKERA